MLELTLFAGQKSRTTIRTDYQPYSTAHQAIRRFYRNRYRSVRRNIAFVTERMLRRLCPSGWTVEVSPSSKGAAPSPAFCETSTGEVYHFANAITTRSPRAEARAAFELRSQQKAELELSAIVDRGEAADVHVCVADSYRAGNCQVGTVSYVKKHSLDKSRHYRAGELSALANGDARFVRSAIISALRRHRSEMSAGICQLSDHRTA